MRLRALLVAAVGATALLSGCGGDATDESAAGPSSAAPDAQALPPGKSVVPLVAGTTYSSPDGFAPQLELRSPDDGWNSTHRGPDAFDVGQPVPGVDAALVVVAFLTPTEGSAAEALDAIERAAQAAGATVSERHADGMRVSDGQGPLVSSRDATIALDAVPGGYADIVGTDTAGGPMVKVTWVPDAGNRARAEQLARALDVELEP